jgi:hypothetical protein
VAKSALRLVGLAAAATAVLIGATSASARTGASFSDATGDANEAPDITSVSVSDAAEGTVTVHVAVGNLQTLPPDASFLLEFDLDNDVSTGAGGDEAVARYSADGTFDLFRWTGFELARASADGMTASFSSGVLTFTANRSQLSGSQPFGIVVVAARRQVLGGAAAVATDFAPVGSPNVYSPPGEKSFTDPEGDEDAAPDISSVSVTDAHNGIITFRITTSNYATLREDKLIGLGFDLLGRPDSSDELFLTYQGGAGSVDIEREAGGLLTQDEPPNRITTRYAEGVLTIAVHRSELHSVAAFKFGVVTADLVGDGEGEGVDALGDIEAIDVSPSGLESGTLFSYKLTNPPPVRLSVSPVAGTPASPHFGKPFTVSVVVTRSDTGKVVRVGAVTCNATLGTVSVPSSGRFRDGKARCTLTVPTGKHAGKLRVTMKVRANGASVRSVFSYVVR